MEGLLPMGVHRLAIYERMVLTFSSFLMPQNSRTLPKVENIYIYIYIYAPVLWKFQYVGHQILC